MRTKRALSLTISRVFTISGYHSRVNHEFNYDPAGDLLPYVEFSLSKFDELDRPVYVRATTERARRLAQALLSAADKADEMHKGHEDEQFH